jgi:phosphodiesterase/alkaline phosphatase D-like protein
MPETCGSRAANRRHGPVTIGRVVRAARVVRQALAGAFVAFAVLGANVALAASGPSVTTGAASGVGATSATLTGSVNPQGQATTYHFEYGTTTAYGSSSSSGSAGNGTAPVTVSAALASLTPNTTYHYRLVASNPTGTTAGADATFTTAAQPPAAATGAASSVGTTSAALSGSVNPEGQATTYHFEYGPSTAYGAATPSSNAGNGTASVSANATLGSLYPNTTYHYRIVATNGTGTTSGADQTFTTAPLLPAAATGASKSVGGTSASLAGTVNPEGQATTYYFQYGTTTAYGTDTGSRAAGNGTMSVAAAAALASLTPNTTYHYRIVATNGSGTTVGADRHFTTAARPPGVSTGAVRSASASSATLTGSIDPRGQSTVYYFEYGTTAGYGSRTPSASAGAADKTTRVSATIGALAPNTTYHYRIVAVNGSGTSAGADRTFKTAAPSSVTLSASPAMLRFGGATRLTGTVRGAERAHTTVTLQRASSRAGPFLQTGVTRTAANGTFAFTALPGSRTYFRVIAGVATSPTVLVTVHFRIALFVSRRHPRRGHRVRFHGTVHPARNGLRVLIQRLGPDHRWHTIRAPRLHPTQPNTAAYSVVIRIRRNGLWRAVVGPNAGNARAFSRVIRIQVRRARQA